MSPFILYQLKAGLCIMLFTALYFALFRKETFYRFNRIYLTGTLIISAILPLIQLPVINTTGAEGITQFISAVTVKAGNTMEADPALKSQIPLLVLIYRIVALLFVGHLIYQLARIFIVVVKQGSIRLGNYRLISLPRKSPTFSFFNLVFISASTPQEGENNQVLLHELAHARQMHSLDIILIQIFKIFQWFNPFIYFTEKALQETHEYLADEAVLEQDGDSGRYRLLLVTQVFGVQPGILSFFNYSLIKNRLTMMTKEKSPLLNRLKYLTILPLVFMIGMLLCCNTSNKEVVSPPPPPPPPPAEEQMVVSDNDSAFVYVDEMAQFQGGSLETFREWVQKNLEYPEEAVKNGISGRVTIQFAVNTRGKVEDVIVLRSANPILSEESIRIIKSSPEWIAAKKDGKGVKQQFVMPVIFQLQ